MATVQRYIHAESAGGNGTTWDLSGTNAAYASVATWEAAEDGLGSSSDDHVVDLKRGSGAADGSTPNIGGWTVNSITMQAASTDQAVPSFNGATAYLISNSSAIGFTIAEPNVTIRGLNIQATSNSTTTKCIYVAGTVANGFTIEDCYVRMYRWQDWGANHDRWAMQIYQAQNVTIRNNCIHIRDLNLTNTLDQVIGIYSYGQTANGPDIYNNTIFVNCKSHDAASSCIWSSGPGTNIKNNLLWPYDASIKGIGNASGTGSTEDYNATTDTTTTGSNSRNSQTFTLTDADNRNLTLESTDTGAKGYGVDLTTIGGFSDDMEGDDRGTTWDIGADQYAVASNDGVLDESIPTLTASGTGEVPMEGAGTPSLPTLTASGAGTVLMTGVGQLELPNLFGENATNDASGAVTLPDPPLTTSGLSVPPRKDETDVPQFEANNAGASIDARRIVFANGKGYAVLEGNNGVESFDPADLSTVSALTVPNPDSPSATWGGSDPSPPLVWNGDVYYAWSSNDDYKYVLKIETSTDTVTATRIDTDTHASGVAHLVEANGVFFASWSSGYLYRVVASTLTMTHSYDPVNLGVYWYPNDDGTEIWGTATDGTGFRRSATDLSDAGGATTHSLDLPTDLASSFVVTDTHFILENKATPTDGNNALIAISRSDQSLTSIGRISADFAGPAGGLKGCHLALSDDQNYLIWAAKADNEYAYFDLENFPPDTWENTAPSNKGTIRAWLQGPSGGAAPATYTPDCVAVYEGWIYAKHDSGWYWKTKATSDEVALDGYAQITNFAVSDGVAWYVDVDYDTSVNWNSGDTITDHGYYWGTSSPPTNKVSVGSGTGSQSGSQKIVLTGQTHYFQAYATTSSGEMLSAIQTISPADQAPGAITGLTVTGIDHATVQLNWTQDPLYQSQNRLFIAYSYGATFREDSDVGGWPPSNASNGESHQQVVECIFSDPTITSWRNDQLVDPDEEFVGVDAVTNGSFKLLPDMQYTFRVLAMTPDGTSTASNDYTFTTSSYLGGASDPDDITVTLDESYVTNQSLIHALVWSDNYIYTGGRAPSALWAKYDPTDIAGSWTTTSVTQNDVAEPDYGYSYGNGEQIVNFGSYIYVMSKCSGSNDYARIIKINKSTWTAEIVNAAGPWVPGTDGFPDSACTDGTYIFFSMTNRFVRYDPATDAVVEGSVYTGRGSIHTCVADNSYLYGVSSGVGSGLFELDMLKIDKSDLSLVASEDIELATDDMDHDATYLYTGCEAMSGRSSAHEPFGTTRNRMSVVASRKSDLKQFALGPLGPSWDDYTWSYAVYRFGDYLLNLCTNSCIYIIDATDPSQWSIDANPYDFVLAEVKFTGAPVLGPANEMTIDQNGDIHVSYWDEPSGLGRFSIPGYQLVPTPAVTTDAPTVNGASGSADLQGTITNKGASAITGWGYYYGTTNPPTNKQAAGGTPNLGTIDPWTWSSVPKGDVYVQAYAENGHGEGKGEVVAFTVDADGIVLEDLPTPTATGEGIVYIKGAANAYLPILALTADGYVPVRGTGDGTLPEITVTAEGTVLIEGQAVAVLPNLETSGYGTGPAELSGAVQLPVIDILEADGDLGPVPLDGVGYITIPQLTGFGTAEDTEMQGSGRFDLPILIGQGVASNDRTGIGAVAIPAIEISATGKSEGFLVYVRHAGDEIVNLTGVTDVSATVVEGNSFLYEDKSCSVADATKGIVFVPAANGLTVDTTYRLQLRISWGSEFTFSFPSEGYTSFRLKTPES